MRTQDLFRVLLTLTGYVEVLVIPAGARRIKVVEERPAHSYLGNLSLRDTGKQSINSDWKIEHSGAFNLAGTTVHYVRRGLWEKISAKGERKTIVSCTKIMNKNISIVDSKKCKYLTKPEPQIRKCNEQPCQTSDMIGENIQLFSSVFYNKVRTGLEAALTFKCLGDQWPVYCRVIREKNLCQDMRWYQRCCDTCRDFYAQKLQQKS
ncbi:hypothetical protein HPG69_017095 [Diceros bicornis minor]|uniref:PLAC domain-containing protein n=1 Tax=Diceros bicornis minor TaxID=77932 RepID=A0A7J7ECQ9_DICBM|nr:hypothetical protein HPG69_017095 [Diceros bicornis minor]